MTFVCFFVFYMFYSSISSFKLICILLISFAPWYSLYSILFISYSTILFYSFPILFIFYIIHYILFYSILPWSIYSIHFLCTLGATSGAASASGVWRPILVKHIVKYIYIYRCAQRQRGPWTARGSEQLIQTIVLLLMLHSLYVLLYTMILQTIGTITLQTTCTIVH